MAEDSEKEESGGGGGGLIKIILLVVGLLVGAGGGFFFGKGMGEKTAKEAQQLEPAAENVNKDPNTMVGEMFKLEPFVVNLSEPRGNRYLKSTIELEMDSEALKSELERRKAQLRDTILQLLTSKSSQELQAMEGKFRLRDELLSRINAMLVNGTVTRVYFTEFVIQ
ncbi:MAG: flagellar basal body-associated FliL family protein [Magnetococcales bacterium]|nr:flagellar basal body-associated FliL family protein [Magnetococcales bacterium]MBF0148541.1 flagellar basal body-associated FliL family protein [Magnetococcales bacterium]MBF0346491.1 flagellar basal body-associated FliL family protein [Magnetococcales bacterium]